VKRAGKVLEFASKLNSKAWENFRIMPMRPSVNPNEPPMYLIDVAGKRMDGVVFTITVAIRKDRHDLMMSSQVIDPLIGVMNEGIRQLMEFTGCACTSDTECEKHRRPLVN